MIFSCSYIRLDTDLFKLVKGCPTVNVSANGIMKDYVRATREPYHNVHFCGTESATRWQGYIDGAAESGERAANEVLHKMKSQLPTAHVDYEKTYYYQQEQMVKSYAANNQDDSSWFNFFTKSFFSFALVLLLVFYSFVFFKLN